MRIVKFVKYSIFGLTGINFILLTIILILKYIVNYKWWSDLLFPYSMFILFIIIPMTFILVINMLIFKERYLSYKFSSTIIALIILQFLLIWLLRVYMG